MEARVHIFLILSKQELSEKLSEIDCFITKVLLLPFQLPSPTYYLHRMEFLQDHAQVLFSLL